jgi:predicted transporter
MTRAWWAAVCYATFIAVLVALANIGSFPMPIKSLRTLPCADAIGHFLLMGGLAFFVNLALEARVVRVGPAPILLGSLIVFAIVLAEEISQQWLRHRTFSWTDLFGDVVGIICFGSLARAIVLTKRERAAGSNRI